MASESEDELWAEKKETLNSTQVDNSDNEMEIDSKNST
jgi:hypothetical protein